jgi:hypothetical protein
MTLRDYAYWSTHGQPYELCAPERAYVDRMRAYGYVVYHYPDESHLTADLPEDHTPFSHTGWPVESPYGIAFASDTMPDRIPPGCPTLPQLARQVIADKNAGVPGTEPLKYINWTDEAGNCWHDSWQPSHARRASTDKGHIHRSARSDSATSHIADAYDPVARWRAGRDKNMIFIKQPDSNAVWITDGLTRRHVKNPAEWDALCKTFGLVQTYTTVADVNQFGPDADAMVAPATTVTVDAAALTAAVDAAVAAAIKTWSPKLDIALTGSATPVTP